MTEDEIRRAAAATKDDIGRQKVSGPVRIWLEPECCACRETGRVWCEDNVWPNSDCEATGTEYVRADAVAKLVEAAIDVHNLLEANVRTKSRNDAAEQQAIIVMRTALAKLTVEG